MSFLRKHKLLGPTLGVACALTSLPSISQVSRQDCQAEINKMREIYIVILRKIPAMPPLAQLSPGIQRAINDGEMRRDSGDYSGCVANMQRQIAIVQGYAR
jgi:hypothetical protein